MGERRTVSFEDLGSPQEPGRYPVRGIGYILVTKQDIEEWKDQEFKPQMMIIRVSEGINSEHEWQFVGWHIKRLAA